MSHTSLSSENGSAKYDCEESDSIPFLDVLCSIKDGKIVTDLCRKESERNQYLLTSSCHPVECTNNIPFSLARNDICSNFQGQSSPPSKSIKTCCPKSVRQETCFVVTYDPRLPSIPAIQHKHWRALVATNQYVAEVFPEPPLTAFRRQTNIGEYLIRAKVPPSKSRSKRELKGMTKCNKPCHACPFIMEGKEVKSDNFTWKITQPMKCETENCVYMIECNKEKCKQRYIGENEDK
jgi:hypothetical protein